MEKYQYDAVDDYQVSVIKAAENRGSDLARAVMQICDEKVIAKCLRYDTQTEEERIAAVEILKKYMFYYNLNSIQIIHERKNVYYKSKDFKRENLTEYKEDANLKKILEFQKEKNNFINGSILPQPEKGIVYLYRNYSDYIFILSIDEISYKKNVLQYAAPFQCSTWIYYKDTLSITNSKNITDIVKEYNLDINSVTEKERFNLDNSIVRANRSGNYTIITMIPRADFQKELNRNILVLVIVAAIIILICIASLIIHMKYFRNIKQIYIEKIGETQNELEGGKWRNVMYKIFTGLKLTNEERQLVFRKLNKNNNNIYVPLFLLIDDYIRFDSVTLNKIKNDIISVFYESFADMLACYVIQIEKKRIAAIICCDPTIYETMNNNMENICNHIKGECGISVSMVIGKSDYNYENIEENVLGLFQITQYHFIGERGEVIRQEEALLNPNSNSKYPVEIQGNMILALKNQDNEKFDELCEVFVKYIKDNNYLMGKQWGIKLYMNIMNVIKPDESYNEPMSDNSFGNIKEIFAKLKEARASVTEETPDEFKSKILELVEENYADSDYNISMIADSIGISAVYAGQKFKKNFDMTFNVYLAEYRCKKAAELLLRTNKKSVEIAALCGFKSDTYYNYIFKKYMGVTPLQYRKQYRKL